MSGWNEVTLGETWNYKEAKVGDSLEGIYAGKEENVGENNSNIYRIENEEGDAKNVWGSTVLDTRMKNLKIGEEVKIVYKGKKPSPNRKGKDYHDFQVFRRKADTTEEAAGKLAESI